MTLLLKCFQMENVWNSSATMQFFYLTSKASCHIIQKPSTHGHPKLFQHCHSAHIFPLSLSMVNLLLLCNLNFTSSTLLSWLSFSYQTGMQVFYVTPALVFWFVVVSSVFQLFSSLDRFSLIPTTSTNFRHHLQAWIHSTLVTQVPEPFPITLEVLHIMGSTQNTLSSFIKIAVG